MLLLHLQLCSITVQVSCPSALLNYIKITHSLGLGGFFFFFVQGRQVMQTLLFQHQISEESCLFSTTCLKVY